MDEIDYYGVEDLAFGVLFLAFGLVGIFSGDALWLAIVFLVIGLLMVSLRIWLWWDIYQFNKELNPEPSIPEQKSKL